MKNISLKKDASGDILLYVKSEKKKQSAIININALMKKLGPITGSALYGWAEENLEEED